MNATSAVYFLSITTSSDSIAVWRTDRIANDGKERSDEQNAELRQKARSKRLRLAAGVQSVVCTLLFTINKRQSRYVTLRYTLIKGLTPCCHTPEV